MAPMKRARQQSLKITNYSYERQPESFLFFNDFDDWLGAVYYGAGIPDRMYVFLESGTKIQT
ncbi:MAG: hypothetical protein WB780_08165 [Candidatus Acidiferrales bacterium]